jgi:hypothetical protein
MWPWKEDNGFILFFETIEFNRKKKKERESLHISFDFLV